MHKSISKNAMFKAALNLFNIILPILVTSSVNRALGATNIGYITIGESYTSYFLIFASFGIYQYGLREISKVRSDKKKLGQTFTSLFLITVFTNLFVTAVYMIFITSCYKDQAYYYTCMVLGFNLFSNTFYVEWINEALENFSFITIKTIIIRIIYSVLIVALIRGTDDFTLYIYIVVAFNFINNIASYIYVRRSVKFDFSHLRFLKHIKPMFFVVILSNIGVLYTQVDKIMLTNVPGGADVKGLAYYGNSQKIMTIINTLVFTIIQVTIPRLSNYLGNEKKEEYIALLNKVIKIYFLLLFPASIGLFTISQQAMGIYGGTDFVLGGSVMAVFSLYMIIGGIESVISQQMIYLNGREKDDVYLVLIGGIINVVLNFILMILGRLTAVTAISTTFISNLILLCLEYRFVKNKMKLDIKMFSLDNMKYLYYSLLFIPIAFAVNRLISNIYLSCMCIMAACGLLYLGILFFTKDSMFFELLNKVLVKLKIKKA